MTVPEQAPTRAENFRRFLAHQLVEQHGAEPDTAPTVAGILANATTFDEDGKVVVRDRFGMPTTAGIDDLVAEFRAAPGNAAFFKAVATKPDTKPADGRSRVLATVAGAYPMRQARR